jgi:hypothetical protein
MLHQTRSVGIVAFPELTPERPFAELISMGIATIDSSRAHAIQLNGRWYVPVEDHEHSLELHTAWETAASDTDVPIKLVADDARRF